MAFGVVAGRPMDTTRHAMVGRLVIRRPGENAWSKRVAAFGCLLRGDGCRFGPRQPSPRGKPIKSDLTKALSGRSISVSEPTGRRRPRREWATTRLVYRSKTAPLFDHLTLDRGAMHLKDELMPKYAELVYYGFWFSPEREMLQAAIDRS
jgi:hypothetical protein